MAFTLQSKCHDYRLVASYLMVTLKYSIESVPVGDEAVELPKTQHNKPSSAAPWTVGPETTPGNVNTGN